MFNIIHHQGNKTSVRHHFTPNATVVTKTPKSADRDVETLESSQELLVEM